MSYLEQLIQENMHQGALTKLTKPPFDSFDSRSRRHFSENNVALPKNPVATKNPASRLKQPPKSQKRAAPILMGLPIICGGVECGKAYLPNCGGLVCGLNLQPVLRMSACPIGRWDRGFPVFGARAAQAQDKER